MKVSLPVCLLTLAFQYFSDGIYLKNGNQFCTNRLRLEIPCILETGGSWPLYLALLSVGLGSTFLFHDTFPEWFGETNSVFGGLWLFVAEINIYQFRVGFISLHE